MSYAHGGRKVELKGAEKLLRRQEEERRQAAEREKERAFQAAVERYSRPRRAVHDFIKTQPYWGHFFMGVILAYALMLGFKDPLVAEGAPGWDRPGFGIDNALIEGAEPYFTVLFTVDMVGGLTTYGFRRFFKDSWNLMDTVVVGSGWLDLAGLETGVGMLRMIRVFRPLRTLTKVESMRLIVSALVASVPGLASVLMLAGFMVFIFALFGLKMWIGVLSGRCFEPSAVAAGEQASLSWVGTHRHCCAQEQCGNDTCAATAEACVLYGNPEHGSQSFDNIGSAVLAVFTAMTAEGWSEIMDRLLDSQNATIVGVFFMMLMVMGGLL